MKSNFTKLVMLSFMIAFLCVDQTFAQGSNFSKSNVENQSTVMTWNKNTPEQEMLDDIKALKKQGITIKYSNIKRNPKGEIVALRIEYKDLEGNSGSQEYNGKNAIVPIKFYKNKNGIGFGETNTMGMAFNNFDFNDLQKSFGNQIQINPLIDENFGFSNDPNPKMKKKSKIMIQENGKKPLVIEDGQVVEGGEDYTKEELDKIKNQHKFELNDNGNQKLDFNSDDFDMKDLKEQIEKVQNQLLQIMPNNEKGKKNLKDLRDLKSDKEITKDDLKQAKEEMLKAKKEMEEAKKELQKAKSEMIMRKI
jgi:hypothetical protein